MGIYFTSYFLGLMLGPIIAGNMAVPVGWRNFFWLCTGLSALNLVLLFFLFPETKFHRDAVVASSQSHSEHEAGNKESPLNVDLAHNPYSHMRKGKPCKSQWRVWQKPRHGAVSSLLRDVITPVYVVSFPIIAFAATVVGGAANLFLCMNLTQSTVFAAEPYNFTPSKVGFANFAFVVGGAVGLATAGPLSDWIANKLTIRNNYTREPEMRLFAIIPYFVIMAVGTVIIAVGYQYHWPWQAVIIFGFTCIGIQVVALPTCAIAYAVDCYKPISGEILVISTVVKNTFGFGMSFWVPILTPSQSVWILFACCSAPCLLAIPVYIWGKRMRTWTQRSTVHKMEAIM